VLLLDEDTAHYIPDTTPDLKTALEKLSTALEKIASALTAIDTKVLVTSCLAGPGTTVLLPLAATDITAISAAKTQIDTLRAGLK
jgi:hypothetical protein